MTTLQKTLSLRIKDLESLFKVTIGIMKNTERSKHMSVPLPATLILKEDIGDKILSYETHHVVDQIITSDFEALFPQLTHPHLSSFVPTKEKIKIRQESIDLFNEELKRIRDKKLENNSTKHYSNYDVGC